MSEIAEKIARLAALLRNAGTPGHPSATGAGRNTFTLTIDAVLLWIRRYLPPVHRLAAWLSGLALFLYASLVGRTLRVVAMQSKWPNLPKGCVLAVWHGATPSLLSAIARNKSLAHFAIMIATEPRGDSLEVLCRSLGMQVIRGDWEHHGWPAVTRMAELAREGACVLITPDGGGPRCLARPGVLVLAAAAGVPIVAVGAECRPAIVEPNKWDKPRNPLPFARIAISMEKPLFFTDFNCAAEVESARRTLEEVLNEAQRKARAALQLPAEES
jgi:lysophospholipid acyltransferase (LPLAT)-like uncharacterized protein